MYGKLPLLAFKKDTNASAGSQREANQAGRNVVLRTRGPQKGIRDMCAPARSPNQQSGRDTEAHPGASHDGISMAAYEADHTLTAGACRVMCGVEAVSP